jgi:ABC-type nitrate/sulfonate/bicarbonate transport system substrate-binding protein
MSEQAPPAVLAALREALEWQIAHDDPPETARTLARLKGEGIANDEVWRWLAAALLQEMSVMLRDNRPFDRAAYAAALDRLPGLSER